METVAQDPDHALQESLQGPWNAQVATYDAALFPFATWALERVQAHGCAAEDLTDLHNHLDGPGLFRLTKALCNDTHEASFQRLLRRFSSDVIQAVGALEAPLAVQRFPNVRIMAPDRPQAVFPFHTGLQYGHGPASRSLWLPLTDVRAPSDASASMHIIDLETSRALVAQATSEQLSVAAMQALFLAHSKPLSAGPGQVVLFSQEHLHGNVVNTTGKTRVSIDFRIAEARFGDRLGDKPVGGYFSLLNEASVTSVVEPAFDGAHVLYLNGAAPSAPAHLQRLSVFEYCQDRAIAFDFEFFELSAMPHHPTLRHIVETLDANVVLYSIYALPRDADARTSLLDGAIAQGLTLHFANENHRVHDAASAAAVEAILAFARFSEPAPTSVTS
ncbi:MAG: sporadic carbohydrate cluster protein (TIGR04323 family) [Myxococcota bacterium]|jgi:sporadic carbohydrate cluster protein (TIGR04323 family)